MNSSRSLSNFSARAKRSSSLILLLTDELANILREWELSTYFLFLNKQFHVFFKVYVCVSVFHVLTQCLSHSILAMVLNTKVKKSAISIYSKLNLRRIWEIENLLPQSIYRDSQSQRKQMEKVRVSKTHACVCDSSTCSKHTLFDRGSWCTSNYYFFCELNSSSQLFLDTNSYDHVNLKLPIWILSRMFLIQYRLTERKSLPAKLIWRNLHVRFVVVFFCALCFRPISAKRVDQIFSIY